MKFIIFFKVLCLALVLAQCDNYHSNLKNKVLPILEEHMGQNGVDSVYIFPNSPQCINCIRSFYILLESKLTSNNVFFISCQHPSEYDLSRYWESNITFLGYKHEFCDNTIENLTLMILDQGTVIKTFEGELLQTGNIKWELILD